MKEKKIATSRFCLISFKLFFSIDEQMYSPTRKATRFQDTVHIREIPRNSEVDVEVEPSVEDIEEISFETKKAIPQKYVIIGIVIGGAVLIGAVIGAVVGVVSSQTSEQILFSSVSP